MKWSVEFLDQAVLDILRDLPADIHASFTRIVGLIEGYEARACARALCEAP